MSQNNMKIKVYARREFAKYLVTPVCKQSQLLLNLTGGESFTPEHLKTINQLGYTIVDKNTGVIL